MSLELEKQIDAVIRERHLFEDGRRILVAVSGGVDSMVLLALLHHLAPARRWKLTVAHFNHKLRGRASDADECLVRKTAKSLGLPMVVGRGNVKAQAKRQGLSVEMAARNLRHEFLAAAAQKRKIKVIALAHHADDQAELFFLRVLRGTGNKGLGGMGWITPSPVSTAIQLVRPFLNSPKSALHDYAHACGIAFSEDASNASLDVPRNRVRNELIPELRKNYQPALTRAVLRLMDVAGAEHEVVSEIGREWLAKKTGIPFKRLPVAVQREVIQQQLFKLSQVVDYEIVENLRAKPGEAFPLSGGRFLVRAENGSVSVEKSAKLRFKRGMAKVALDGATRCCEFTSVKFSWEVADEPGMDYSRHAGREFFDADKIGPKIVLRHWKPGDRFRQIGAPSAAKLQDIFTNLKVPAAERRRRIVAATGDGKIFWVEGLRIAEGFGLDKTTIRRLIWSWQRMGDAEKAGLQQC